MRTQPSHGEHVGNLLIDVLKMQRQRRDGGALDRPLGLESLAALTLIGELLQTLETCPVTNALMGFADAKIAQAASRLAIDLTPDLQADIRAIEFAFLAVIDHD